jgi:hypothetical protein
MTVDLRRVRAGDKILLRDGSKLVVDDRGGLMSPMVLTYYLTSWKNDGRWADSNPNCGFDIVGIIFSGKRPMVRSTESAKP